MIKDKLTIEAALTLFEQLAGDYLWSEVDKAFGATHTMTFEKLAYTGNRKPHDTLQKHIDGLFGAAHNVAKEAMDLANEDLNADSGLSPHIVCMYAREWAEDHVAERTDWVQMLDVRHLKPSAFRKLLASAEAAVEAKEWLEANGVCIVALQEENTRRKQSCA